MQATLKRKKGTTRELVSYTGVLTVLATNQVEDDLTDADRAEARASLEEILGGGYLVPTGSGTKLRAGKRLAAVVAQRSVERCIEGTWN